MWGIVKVRVGLLWAVWINLPVGEGAGVAGSDLVW